MSESRRREILAQIQQLEQTIRHCMLEKAKLREELLSLAKPIPRSARTTHKVLYLADKLIRKQGHFSLHELMEACLIAGIEFPGNSLYSARVQYTVNRSHRYVQHHGLWFKDHLTAMAHGQTHAAAPRVEDPGLDEEPARHDLPAPAADPELPGPCESGDQARRESPVLDPPAQGDDPVV